MTTVEPFSSVSRRKFGKIVAASAAVLSLANLALGEERGANERI